MSDKPHLSPSQISTWTRCGEAHRRRYVEGERIPPGWMAATGSGTDSGVSANLINKRDAGELLALEEVQEITRDAVNFKWEEGVWLQPEEEEKGSEAVRGQAVDIAVRLVELHHVRLAPIIQPQHIQRKLVAEINNFPYDLVGILDIQEQNGRVRDTKVKVRAKPAEGLADKSLQLTSYSVLVKAVDGEFPELCLDFLVNTKTPTEYVQKTTRNQADYEALFRRIEAMALALEKGIVHPADPDSWSCSRRFCGYAPTCKFYGGRP